jgi:hypothetical protein
VRIHLVKLLGCHCCYTFITSLKLPLSLRLRRLLRLLRLLKLSLTLHLPLLSKVELRLLSSLLTDAAAAAAAAIGSAAVPQPSEGPNEASNRGKASSAINRKIIQAMNLHRVAELNPLARSWVVSPSSDLRVA